MFGDLLQIEEGIILHQVNSLGTMQKGLGSLLNKKYPDLEKNLQHTINLKRANTSTVISTVFGTIIFSLVTDNLTIGNCFSEMGVCSDRKPGDPANTQYDALIKCFDKAESINKEVYVPFGMGCGLAGGDWNIVSTILKKYDFTVVARTSDYENWFNSQQ